jgi:hypothetical protein
MQYRKNQLNQMIKGSIKRARYFIKMSKTDKEFEKSWLLSAKFEIEKAEKWINELRSIKFYLQISKL